MAARKRELIEPNPGDKRYVRRDSEGQFKESDDVSRSLSQDQRRKATRSSRPGQGDRGDRPAAKKPAAKKPATKRSSKKRSSKKK